MNLLEKLKNAISVDVDVQNIYEEGMTFEQFEQSLIDRIHEIEVIYYSNAINYLKENDPSLRESLEIAEEFGYSPSNLNSELLATLLKQRLELETWYEEQSEVEDLFNEYEEYLSELEEEE